MKHVWGIIKAIYIFLLTGLLPAEALDAVPRKPVCEMPTEYTL